MSEVLHGNASGEQLNARADKAQAYGLSGNDTLISSGKADVLLIGGSGDDSLIMLGGNGTLAGGKGSDTFELTYSATKPISAVIEDLDPATDKVIINFDGDAAPQLTSVASGDDVVWTDSDGLFNLTLKGVRDNDYFDGTASEEIWEVLKRTNDEREKKNLPLLTISEGLTKGASIRAEEITVFGQNGALSSHTRLDGTNFSTVLDNKYHSYGENLDGGAELPVWVMRDWMNSEHHRENILNETFLKLGVGYNYFDIDESNHRWYWTQLFADGLSAPETVTTAELSTANIELSMIPDLLVPLSENPDAYNNTAHGATINALGGADSITNTNLNVSISGGADNDTIESNGSFTTINAGIGDDVINLDASTKENVIEYAQGDGNDTISGFNETDTLSLSSDEFTHARVGDNIVVTVGGDSITLLDAAKSFVNIQSPNNKIIQGSESNDSISNWDDTSLTINGGLGADTIRNRNTDISINGGAGDDYIYNDASSVSMDGGYGYDTIRNFGSSALIHISEFLHFQLPSGALVPYGSANITNYGDSVTITSNAGSDRISNYGSKVTILGGDGDDTVYNHINTAQVSINSGAGKDSINNFSSQVTISGGDGNDSIGNFASSVSMDGGADSDTIGNRGTNVTLSGGDGNDYILNETVSVSIDGGAGADYITNTGAEVSISGGDGADFIRNENSYVTINSGADNDTVYNHGANVLIHASTGDNFIHNEGSSVSIDGGLGNDTIRNLTSSNVTIDASFGDDTIQMGNGSENNVILYTAGDGNDFIQGFTETDTLSIAGSEYISVMIGYNIAISVGTGSIWLSNAATLPSLNIIGEKSEVSRLITLTEGYDSYENTETGVTIEALGDDDFIQNSGMGASIDGGTGNDFISNYSYGTYSTILGGDDDDYLSNSANYAEIYGGAGDDEINNYGSAIIINAGAGNDSISLSSYSQEILIEYANGDGNDVINGFSENATLFITNVESAPETVGSDVVIAAGTGSISLLGAASLSSVNIVPTYNNTVDGATIQAQSSNDSIYNEGSLVSMDGGAGNDTIRNGNATISGGSSVTMSGNAGDDFIANAGDYATIDGGEGSDFIGNTGAFVTINGGADNDSIQNRGATVSITGGAGADYIDNHGSEITISGGEGNDSIHSAGFSASIDGGLGDDTIDNLSTSATLEGGEGDDYIANNGMSVLINGDIDDDSINNSGASSTLDGGDGVDTITNSGDNVSINGGLGDDSIHNSGANVSITGGDGFDFIYNDESGSLTAIDAGADNDSIQNRGATVSITGGAGDDYVYNDGYSVSIDGGDGDDYISNLGLSATIIGGKGTDSINLTSNEANNNFIVYNLGDGNDTIWGYSTNDTLNILAEDYSSVVSGNDVIFTVGDGSILLRDGREKPLHIIIGESGSSGGGSGGNGGNGGGGSGGNGGGGSGGSGDGGGSSSGGTSNSGNSSGASGGNSASGSSGGTSGGGTGGSNSGRGNDNTVSAAPATSQLWGNVNYDDAVFGGGDADTFTGTDEADTFVSGKSQGSDTFQNISPKDTIYLSDVTLSDIVNVKAVVGSVSLTFNTGNTVKIQSSELLSGAIVLADGSAHRYNHMAGKWQSA